MENNTMQPNGSTQPNQEQFPSFGAAQPTQGPSVPPPPSSDQQVGVRTMESDVESVHQSGGEQPQSHMVSAGDSAPEPAQEVFQPSFQAPIDNTSVPPTAPDTTSPTTPRTSSFNIKTIAIVIGIVVLAVAVGFGVFYLVRSLNSTPTITSPTTPNAHTVVPPVATQTPEVMTPTTTPIVEEIILPPALVHTSILTGVEKTALVSLMSSDIAGIRSAIASSSYEEELVAGTVKDLAFVDVQGSPVESSVITQALLPSVTANLSLLTDRDITGWLYGDKSGGNKLGLIIPLRDGVTREQIVTAFTSLESSPQDVLNMFVPVVPLPASSEFKEGPISGITVRYLAISTKNQQVFEYAPVSVNGKGYLVITSSYNQMVDILKRLSARALTVVAPAMPITPEATTTQ